MPLLRRLALLDWAERNDRFIIEDDYDSEFRYDVAPMPPLASLGHAGRVIYVGTFSKTLAPSLRIGFVTANPAIIDEIARLKAMTDYHCPTIPQRALDIFIREGALDRHVGKMRRLYAIRRMTLQESLAPLEPQCRLRGLMAGLHTWLEVLDSSKVSGLRDTAEQHDILLTPLSRYAVTKLPRNGFVLGYAMMPPEKIRALSTRLKNAFADFESAAPRRSSGRRLRT